MAEINKILYFLFGSMGIGFIAWAVISPEIAISWLVPFVASLSQLVLITQFKTTQTVAKIEKINKLSAGKRLTILAGIFISLFILGIFGIWWLVTYLMSIGVIIPSFVGWNIFFGIFLIFGIYSFSQSKTYNGYLSIAITLSIMVYFTFNEILWWFVSDIFFFILYLAIIMVAFVWLMILIGFLIFRNESVEGKRFLEYIKIKRKKKMFNASVD